MFQLTILPMRNVRKNLVMLITNVILPIVVFDEHKDKAAENQVFFFQMLKLSILDETNL